MNYCSKKFPSRPKLWTWKLYFMLQVFFFLDFGLLSFRCHVTQILWTTHRSDLHFFGCRMRPHKEVFLILFICLCGLYFFLSHNFPKLLFQQLPSDENFIVLVFPFFMAAFFPIRYYCLSYFYFYHYIHIFNYMDW